MATTLNIKENWNELKGKLKEKYPNLTDDDLQFTAGKEDELLGRLEKKLGISKEEIAGVIAGMQLNPLEKIGQTVKNLFKTEKEKV